MTVAAVRHLTPVWTGNVEAPEPPLTFTIEISVTATALPGEAAKVLRHIRQMAEQVRDATVTMAPIAAVPSKIDEAGLWVEPASRQVVRAGRPVPLTRREFDLLLFLCEHPRRVFTRDQLLSQVWGYEWVGGSRTVDVHVRRLRFKLGEERPVVRTVHGIGYRLEDDLDVRFGQASE